MQNGAYLFAAYTIIWAAVFGLVFSLVYRQKRLKRELESLKLSGENKEKK